MTRFFKAVWRVLSGISRAISVLVPLFFLGVFLLAFGLGVSKSTPEPLHEKAALLIAPSGVLVEDKIGRAPV